MTVSPTHLVLLPTYNTGPRLREVVAEALEHWQPILVVVDGSTDGSERAVLELAKREPALEVIVLPKNSGKGAAVLAGAEVAVARGYTHALVMDADGQHPAASIAEFMAASQRRPEAMVLGKPIFPANIPKERLHGRKINTGMVHFETLGPAIDDSLFGFRIYPLGPLLAVLGGRRSGRRYDFDTEAGVRLCWLGVPPVNLAAPVYYFSREEGGVSHFRYVRDNLTLIRLHCWLVGELLFRRWPSLLAHRRKWRRAGLVAGLTIALLSPSPADAAPVENAPVDPQHRLAVGAPEWSDLAQALRKNPDTTADFVERRYFPFKKEPVELRGEVRVSVSRGLSLHYTAPEERTVILDEKGVVVRAPAGEKAVPPDPRAAAANTALRQVLHFDFAALEEGFELFGKREGGRWSLALLPRTDALKRSVGRIDVAGEGTTVRHIEIRRTAKQAILIAIAEPRPQQAFTAEELRQYFR